MVRLYLDKTEKGGSTHADPNEDAATGTDEFAEAHGSAAPTAEFAFSTNEDALPEFDDGHFNGLDEGAASTDEADVLSVLKTPSPRRRVGCRPRTQAHGAATRTQRTLRLVSATLEACNVIPVDKEEGVYAVRKAISHELTTQLGGHPVSPLSSLMRAPIFQSTLPSL